MKLETYLQKNGLLQKDFASMIGKSKVYVHRLLKGAIPNNKEDMMTIVEATNGAVQPNDFYGIHNSG